MIFQIKAFNTKKGWYGNYCLQIKSRQVVKCYYSQGYEKSPKCKKIDFSITVNEAAANKILKEHFIETKDLILSA